MGLTNDLTEDSLLGLLEHLRQPLHLSVRQLVISPEGLANGREMARRDPEFARRVRAEFPDLADSLIGAK